LVSTGTFNVTIRPTFAAFQDQYGLINGDLSAAPYHKGVCNLAAYAFGVNPATPDRSALPLVTLQGGNLQVTYSRWLHAADLSYIVEVSDDLVNWSSGPSYTQQVSVTPLDSAREQVVERDLIPSSSAPHRFIRIRLVR